MTTQSLGHTEIAATNVWDTKPHARCALYDRLTREYGGQGRRDVVIILTKRGDFNRRSGRHYRIFALKNANFLAALKSSVGHVDRRWESDTQAHCIAEWATSPRELLALCQRHFAVIVAEDADQFQARLYHGTPPEILDGRNLRLSRRQHEFVQRVLGAAHILADGQAVADWTAMGRLMRNAWAAVDVLEDVTRAKRRDGGAPVACDPLIEARLIDLAAVALLWYASHQGSAGEGAEQKAAASG